VRGSSTFPAWWASPFVEMHPDDAAAAGLVDGALARIQTTRGEAVAIARLTDRQRPGGLFLPMHWTDAFAPHGRSNPLIASNIDPTSGQPEFKHSPARVRAYRETWKGFLLSREPHAAPAGLDLIWRRIPQTVGHLHEFAGRGDETERAALRRLLGEGEGDLLAYGDPATGARREAWVQGDRLDRVLFIATNGVLPPRAWLCDLLEAEVLPREARATLLFGRPPGPVVDKGPMVCACLKVAARAIDDAAQAGARSVDAIGAATGAGTNCGSCRPEIARRLAALQPTPETKNAA
jgi:assimilatory nitrate reductase catalytic subunit